MSTTIRANDEDGKQSRVKIATGELSRVLGNFPKRALAKFDSHGIAQNRTSTTLRPNDVDKLRLGAKITTGALPSGPGNFCTRSRAPNV